MELWSHGNYIINSSLPPKRVATTNGHRRQQNRQHEHQRVQRRRDYVRPTFGKKSPGGGTLSGVKLAYVRDIATVTDHSEGPVERTGNPLDLSIAGDGFFVVQTDNGDRYTRNGRFKLDTDGQLVTQQGNPVMSSGNSPFFFSPEDTEIVISRDGTISTNNGELGKIKLVRFDNLQILAHSPGGLFSSEEKPKENDGDADNGKVSQIMQGTLEGSNIKPIFEMAKMIEINRKYDGIRTFMTREDERMRAMIKEMGTQA